MTKHKLVIAALLGVVLLAAITALASAKPAKKTASGSINIVGVWTGPEEKSFNAVLDGFRKANPGIKVSYKSTGDNTPTVLSTAVQGGVGLGWGAAGRAVGAAAPLPAASSTTSSTRARPKMTGRSRRIIWRPPPEREA